MWLCKNHPIGVHRLYDPAGQGEYTITVPLDGFMACDCDAFADSRAKLKSRADEFQITCRHIAQISASHCGWRADHAGHCLMCGKDMIRIEDVVPGWIGNDRKSLLADVLQIRKELHEDDPTGR